MRSHSRCVQCLQPPRVPIAGLSPHGCKADTAGPYTTFHRLVVESISSFTCAVSSAQRARVRKRFSLSGSQSCVIRMPNAPSDYKKLSASLDSWWEDRQERVWEASSASVG